MAAYRVPRTRDVEDTIRKVLDKHYEMGSLKTLHEFVLDEMRKEEPTVRVSPERVRRTAALMEGVTVHVEKGHSKTTPHSCSVCGGGLSPLKSVDLYGKRTTVGRKCPDCGFRIEKEMSAPLRYRFYRR